MNVRITLHYVDNSNNFDILLLYSTVTSSPTTDTCVSFIPNLFVVLRTLIYERRRFYPDGTVLSLLANEELSPSQVIPILKPSLRMKARCTCASPSCILAG